MNPFFSFELLFFAVFGQTTTEQTRVHRNDANVQPVWTNYLFKIVFGIYMLVSVVVLINLLIAMMSDTYQRIQVTRATHTHRPTRPYTERITIQSVPIGLSIRSIRLIMETTYVA